MTKWFVAASLAVLLAAGGFFVWQQYTGPGRPAPMDWSKLSGDIYHCDEDKAFKVDLSDDTALVKLTLSDGRILTLKNTRAIYEGQQFKSDGGTIILMLNPGGSASFEENNVETFKGCINSQG